MKATDFIIEYLIKIGVTDLFGYPGGVICHLMDSAYKYQTAIAAHTAYHEQGAAMAACGYAQVTGKVGAAYATSGPGALNLVTGIANAYFDAVPVLFFTGQVDTYASKGNYLIRQRGFQETDIVAVTAAITKRSVYVDTAEKLPEYLSECYQLAVSGRPGPVVIDLPADIQRADIPEALVREYLDVLDTRTNTQTTISSVAECIVSELQQAKHPCIIAGAGILQSNMADVFRAFAKKCKIPVVMTMNAVGLLPYQHESQFGFIGANGHRSANCIMAKSDMLLSLGARLDLKQVGNKREEFLRNAKLIRVDVDEGELGYRVRSDEIQYCADLKDLLPLLVEVLPELPASDWLKDCQHLKSVLYENDYDVYHEYIQEISKQIPEHFNIVTDCGQSQVWTLQALQVKEHQKVFTTGGLGTMGYALPAAIGMFYGDRKPVVAFAGDGGFQMNIQELQFLSREQLPVKIVVLNNKSLGMIRHFQEMNFEKHYCQTTQDSGYTTPCFEDIATAYHIGYHRITLVADVAKIDWIDKKPTIIEVELPVETYLLPRFGKVNGFSDAEPLLPIDLLKMVEDM